MSKSEKVFSKVYEEQIEKGNSKLFAEQYANLMCEGYNERFCFAYAKEYEEAKDAGCTEDNSKMFADWIADRIVYIMGHGDETNYNDAMNNAIFSALHDILEKNEVIKKMCKEKIIRLFPNYLPPEKNEFDRNNGDFEVAEHYTKNDTWTYIKKRYYPNLERAIKSIMPLPCEKTYFLITDLKTNEVVFNNKYEGTGNI